MLLPETDKSMKTTEQKKKLLEQYKYRKIVGCVYAIKNNVNGKLLLGCAHDSDKVLSRFNFLKSVDSPFSLKLQKDWKTCGKDAFVCEILEEYEKSDEQNDEEFLKDLRQLLDLWKDKLKEKDFY